MMRMEEVDYQMLNKLKASICNYFFLKKYPFWKLYDYRGKFQGYNYSWHRFIPTGWWKAFGKQLSDEIKAAGIASRKRLGKRILWKDLIRWDDIKEKWGELRLSATTTPEIEHVLEKYELLSIGYCERCGKPARYVTRGLVEYMCADCFKENLPSLMTDEDRVKVTRECRLTSSRIPHRVSYTKSKTDKLIKHVVNTKKIYGVDYEELWGLKEE